MQAEVARLLIGQFAHCLALARVCKRAGLDHRVWWPLWESASAPASATAKVTATAPSTAASAPAIRHVGATELFYMASTLSGCS